MLKRIFTLLTALCLICLTACGSGSQASGANLTATGGNGAQSSVLQKKLEDTMSITKVKVPREAKTSHPTENWAQWPAMSELPDQLHMDMSIYKDRPVDSKPLDGITIILDPGHGGKDPGAVGTDAQGQLVYEKDLNLQIAMKIKPLLDSLGAKVIMTRTEDNWVSLYQRVVLGANASLSEWLQAAKRQGVSLAWTSPLLNDMQKIYDINDDQVETGGRGMFTGVGVNDMVRTLFDAERQTDNVIYLSIHCNSTAEFGKQSHGAKIYYCTNASIFKEETMSLSTEPKQEIEPINPNYQFYNDEARIRLASAVYNGIQGMVPELHNPDEPPLILGNYAFIRETNLASILVECGYMTDAVDLANLMDPASQDKIASGIAAGVYNYFCYDGPITAVSGPVASQGSQPGQQQGGQPGQQQDGQPGQQQGGQPSQAEQQPSQASPAPQAGQQTSPGQIGQLGQ